MHTGQDRPTSGSGQRGWPDPDGGRNRHWWNAPGEISFSINISAHREGAETMLRRIAVAALLGSALAAGFGAMTTAAHADSTTAAVCAPHTTTCGPARDPWVWD
jgi:hypothetical protein